MRVTNSGFSIGDTLGPRLNSTFMSVSDSAWVKVNILPILPKNGCVFSCSDGEECNDLTPMQHDTSSYVRREVKFRGLVVGEHIFGSVLTYLFNFRINEWLLLNHLSI